MILTERPPVEIITQFAAATSALDSLALQILALYVRQQIASAYGGESRTRSATSLPRSTAVQRSDDPPNRICCASETPPPCPHRLVVDFRTAPWCARAYSFPTTGSACAAGGTTIVRIRVRPDGRRRGPVASRRRAPAVHQRGDDGRNRRRRPMTRPTDQVDAFGRAVGDLVHGNALICQPEQSIREAARLMTDANQSAILINLGGTLGILTDRDLRARVIAGGVPLDAPVTAGMSSPVRHATIDRPVAEVVMEMLDQGIHHLPITTPDGEVVGIIEPDNLLALERRSPFRVREAIDQAATVPGCAAAAAELWPAVIAMHDARMDSAQVAQATSLLIAALTRKLIELTVAAERPSAEFSWLALGSLARGESLPSSDVDCAISWHGPETPELADQMSHLAETVLAGLEQCGLSRDNRNAVASHPLFSRSAESWHTAARNLVEHPLDDEALILTSILVEARPIWGSDVAAPSGQILTSSPARSVLLRLLARLALTYPCALGFRGRIALQRSGLHKGTLDIKRGGLIPIIDLARYAGMAAGTAAGSTIQRLAAARLSQTLDPDDIRVLEQAFTLLHQLRLDHQVDQLKNGHPPDNFIDPARLDRLTRDVLRDALRATAAVQHNLGAELDLRIR